MTDGDALLDAGSDLHRLHLRGKFLRKGIKNSSLNVNSIAADTCLSGIAILRCDRRLDCGVDIGIVKDDEGALPPSSSESFFIVGADCAISTRPTSVDL